MKEFFMYEVFIYIYICKYRYYDPRRQSSVQYPMYIVHGALQSTACKIDINAHRRQAILADIRTANIMYRLISKTQSRLT